MKIILLAASAVLIALPAVAQDRVSSTLPAPCGALCAAPVADSVATVITGDTTADQANRQAVTIAEPRQPVAIAFAAPLTFSTGTCYVSASAGGQGVTFGLSAAVPIEDKGCTARATAQALYAMGERKAALRFLASQNKAVAAALAGSQ